MSTNKKSKIYIMKEGKKQYLMTDDGFLTCFLVNLSIMLTIAFLCHQNTIPALTHLTTNTYYSIIEFMMKTANEFACWSILGLLSSACCAIQIILNAFSLGCAGFNTILGPLRPMFVALTVMAQGGSWFTAWKYGLIRKSLAGDSIFRDKNVGKSMKMMIFSTLFSIGITCMPELLAWNSTRQQKCVRNKANDSQNQDVMEIIFQIDSMGCASCVSTVSAALDSCYGIIRHSISFEDGIVRAMFSRKSFQKENMTMKGEAWIEIEQKLGAAGFPPK
eukprot:CAMPEP_0194256476 /NCGR_PEP_ID=MMETSP0158-20130606/36780_1 /TAXON_ID=33649 /ORGANISM="Thalassionema nitzschioides, Strain L26-B" /LENGTH=275 /DNA_ID=CAMNT_0038995169 /DNA_START=1 /DNA_END=825 /DNA_ORIENTATION=-